MSAGRRLGAGATNPAIRAVGNGRRPHGV